MDMETAFTAEVSQHPHLLTSPSGNQSIHLFTLTLASQYTERYTWLLEPSVFPLGTLKNRKFQKCQVGRLFRNWCPSHLSIFSQLELLRTLQLLLPGSLHYHTSHISEYQLEFIKHAGPFLNKMMCNDSQLAWLAPAVMSDTCQEYSPVIFQGNARCLSKHFKGFHPKGEKLP